MNDHAILKAVSQRLNQTPVDELPKCVGFLATAILDCSDVIRKTQQGQQQGANALHRLKTRASALLQDRTLKGRFSGIVIVKALIEAGGSSIINESTNWVRQLLSCLNKPDPPEVKRTCILTLTRTFLLSSTYQSSIAQVATPNLPAFILACLNLVKSLPGSAPSAITSRDTVLSATVLRCFHQLIIQFPAIFRPQLSSIRSFCLDVLSSDVHDSYLDDLATDLLARLHFGAPRNTISTEWLQTCSRVIEDAHNAADLVFRALLEHWKPSTSRISQTTKKQRSCPEVESNTKDATGLAGWHGVAQGSHRLTTHLLLLRKLLCTMHLQALPIPLTEVLDLTLRLSSITIPANKSLPTNPEVSQDERDELWLCLPHIHVATIDLLDSLIHTLGQSLYPVALRMTYQIWDIFEPEFSSEGVRTKTYKVVRRLLDSQLMTVAKADLQVWTLLIQQCCSDIRLHFGLETDQSKSQFNANSGSSSSNLLHTISLSPAVPPTSTTKVAPTPLLQAAQALLPAMIQHFPHTLFPASLRAQLDSTAILTNDHDAMLASVLYPPRARTKDKAPPPSIIPHFARTQGFSLAKEALLRPRMPVIKISDGTETSLEELETYVAEAQPGSSDTMHLDTTAAAPTDTIDTLNSPVKRDFTSILEQSAEEQLADGTLSTKAQAKAGDAQNVSSAKRPRIDSLESKSDIPEPAADTHIQSMPTTGPTGTPAAVAINDAVAHVQTSAQVALDDTYTTHKGKGRASLTEDKPEIEISHGVVDEDPSSDESDEPVIDGTLAWELSDDEEEDDEAETS